MRIADLPKIYLTMCGLSRLFVVRNVERLASPGVRIGCPTAISFPRAGAASAQPSSPGPSSLGTSASMNSGFKQESPSSSPFSSSQSEQLSQGTDTNFCPISRLNPYINYWKIKARVTQKSPLQSWSNDRGSGVRFQITFMDKTGKIQATSFEERLYGVLQKHSVYTVSNAAVNPIRKEFTKLDHDCEIILKGGALIEEVSHIFAVTLTYVNTIVFQSESDGDVPNSWETFIPLRDLQSQEKGSLCGNFKSDLALCLR